MVCLCLNGVTEYQCSCIKGVIMYLYLFIYLVSYFKGIPVLCFFCIIYRPILYYFEIAFI